MQTAPILRPWTESLETRRLLALATSTVLTSNANPAVFGQSVTLTANVSAGAATPTGSVTFKDGATVLGTATLNTAHKATFTWSKLTVGAHNLSAVYAGNTSFAASTSPIVAQKVNAAATTTTLTKSLASSVYGQVLTLAASVLAKAPGAGVPTGSVTFKNGATVLGTVALASGKASLSVSNLSVGTASLTATYATTTNFAASASTTIAHAVNAAQTTTTLTKSVASSVYGQALTLTASVLAKAPGAGVPTGSVTFKNGSTVLGTVALASGKASLTISNLAVGTASLTATYAATTNFAASTSAASSHAVTQASTTTTLTLSSLTPLLGQAVTLTATVKPVAPGSGVPTGTVTFKEGATVLGTATLNASGVATFALTTPLFTGPHAITATYAGSTNHKTSISTATTMTVKMPTLTTTATGLQKSTITAGTGTALTAKGNLLKMNYTGWLTNGTKFDSSLNAGREPFVFTLGAGQVIKGWDEGVAGMKLSETRVLVIPPGLGYGSTANGSIPANSTLIFVVSVLAINPPRLRVFGGTNYSVELQPNQTPSTATGTNFGSRPVGVTGAASSFGLATLDQYFNLSLTGSPFVKIAGANPGDFILTQPTSANGFVFTISFKPTAKGTRTATITIPTNDPNLPNWTFTVTGVGA
ncbi:MAG: Ig-like domain repeat protein [Tepidisphaeraceae bacterium]